MKELQEMLDIIDKIRKDCPVDRKRDYKNIISNLKKEILELEQAIDNEDIDNFSEELGDILLRMKRFILFKNVKFGNQTHFNFPLLN